MDAIEQESYRGGRVEIVYDEASGTNPRDDESNLSRFVFRPQRNIIDRNEIGFPWMEYDYDDEPLESEAEWTVRKLREDYGALYVIAVHYSEHGPECRYDVWSKTPDAIDHGEIGYAIVTRESADEIGTPEDLWPEVVAGEVERYGEWASGHVYGYIAYAPDGSKIESVWGYIGYDEIDYMKTEGRAAIDYFIDARERTSEDIAADAMAELLTHVG
jgi:hypothetical protein